MTHPIPPRRLGRSGLVVSALGLGCWALGGALAAGDQPLGYAGVDDVEAGGALHRAVELGVTLLDTADVYGAGHSERLLAPVLAAHPEVLVATKFGNTFDQARRQLTGTDTSPAYVQAAVRASLGRLGRDRIDLYQLHTPDLPVEQAVDLGGTLETLVADGLIAWYGVSTDTPAHVAPFISGAHLTAVQLQLNVVDDNPAMLALCDEHDLAALCRSPLAMGLLGGRYTAATTLPADDIRGTQPPWLRWFTDGRPDPDFLARIDTVRQVLTGDGRTLPQGALAWIWPTMAARSHCRGSATSRRSPTTSAPWPSVPSPASSTPRSRLPSTAERYPGLPPLDCRTPTRPPRSARPAPRCARRRRRRPRARASTGAPGPRTPGC